LAALTTLTDEARIALDTVTGRATNLFSPSIRLGVSGLSRAGKTVFISALVHNLIHGGRLPLFEAQKSGRIAKAYLQHQPDDAVPRFQYEDHIAALVADRIWPDSTRAISELRLTVEFESASAWNRMFSAGRLSIDIVDYPGEWLLDLPLLGKSYAEFSREAFELAELPVRAELSQAWREQAAAVDGDQPADETLARKLAEAFSDYLRACKQDERALSTLPPGRFLMPGDLEGSPALTFAPLPAPDRPAKPGSLRAVMARRYESYKTHVVKPFFREHITRLDRQIVLVDVMQAINAGPAAVTDLERALTEILLCFRPGRGSIFTDLFARRIDRILIAATKADHIHHTEHDKLQAIVRRLADRAIARADFTGASVDAVAMAAVRATREGTVKQGRDTLPVIIGTPIEGETIGDETFDGNTETAVFPGDLPDKPTQLFKPSGNGSDENPNEIRFVRFRPPKLEKTAEGVTLSLPHIRLDRALQFLLGDRLA
jgi:predicted YcjX-like family ATPase